MQSPCQIHKAGIGRVGEALEDVLAILLGIYRVMDTGNGTFLPNPEGRQRSFISILTLGQIIGGITIYPQIKPISYP